MTNRFFTRPALDLNTRRFDQSFSFDREQYFAYCVDLDQKLLEFERRANIQQSLQPETESVTSDAGDSREAHISKHQPTFDDSGFEQDFEIDARWI